MNERDSQILVTGGAGYIGSHTVLALLEADYDVVVIDSLVNASFESLRRVERITGKSLTFIEGDIRDRALLDNIFATHDISAVLHFAGLKAVGESVKLPLSYYESNLAGTVTLCQAMQSAAVFRLVFSSSATIYGPDAPVPYHEQLPRGWPSSPYGMSKAMVERVLDDVCLADERWAVALLRYFNPIGAHESGLIGEDPRGIPNNLLPFIAQVAVGRRERLSIFGSDYPTKDGTCKRDYLHVMDLAEGHVKALERLEYSGCRAYNLGTGQAVSVLEMVDTFQTVSGKTIPYDVVPRREGDLAAFWADPTLAYEALGWQAQRNLNDMIRDTWRWQEANPNGYSGG
ncbi:UDP-glucose 4-epimerase GalE [Vreelandella populi]|uniref:UDP-glucose 4-epimerase n=1 Tax=Vreelandella populi TaxID=2498858 RepID=A0A3S0WPC4_9GAMM|nr:UDP-glucose 4-epimerase GalE [Halomonas populi]RUR35563.1 UDP-glucose 4-epimerase GalE [Halomonas populi]RUR47753.1 UDP-glucose 4-epimerase GalE [Halomonas populi]RUR54384.1 UDP-glucose 4-epimerase GalE [Halomonas populi]